MRGEAFVRVGTVHNLGQRLQFQVVGARISPASHRCRCGYMGVLHHATRKAQLKWPGAPCNGDTPPKPYPLRMESIVGPAVETQLFMHAVGSALALASQSDVVVLDLDGQERQPSPGAQRTAVAERLSQVMSEVDKVIRAQKSVPTAIHAATSGRKLVERGERTDLRGGTYTPGPGLGTLLDAALLDAATEKTN